MRDLEKIAELKKIDQRCFPRLISELIQLIGFEPALKLFVNYSGGHLFIPVNKTNTGNIERLIGDEAFKKLSLRYGSEVIVFTNVNKFINDQKITNRNNDIFNSYKNGTDQREIALKHLLTERTINDIIRKYKP